MTVIDVFEQAKQLSDEERQMLIQMLLDDQPEEPDPRRLLDLKPISLGGLRAGVKLISRDEFYDDEDENGR
jgi:hypothetical protein